MFAGQSIDQSSSAADERPEPPDELRHDLAQYDDTLEPSFAYRWPQAPETGSRWCLLGLDVPPDVDLDRKPPEADEAAWVESPQKKFERLLYETGVSARVDRPGYGRAAGLSARGAAVGIHHLSARSALEASRPPGVLRAQGHPQSQPDARASRPPAAAPHPGREPQVSERGLDPARRAGAGRPVRAAERVRGGR